MLECRRLALAVALLISASHEALAQEVARQGPPQIVTSGQGEIRVVPDRATVSIGVQTRAASAAEASAVNARKQRAVVDAVRAKGVPADQITTTGYNVQPEMKYDKPGSAPIVSGYLVWNVISVQLQRTDFVGPVIDASLAAGANEINSVGFAIANPDSARRAAIAIAVVRAKGDAETAARAAGGTLGSLIELSTGDADMPSPRPMAFTSRAAREGDATQIEAGTQSVRASVTARWLFLSAPR